VRRGARRTHLSKTRLRARTVPFHANGPVAPALDRSFCRSGNRPSRLKSLGQLPQPARLATAALKVSSRAVTTAALRDEANCGKIKRVNGLIEQHRRQIETLCREHGVTRLELFGSAARGDFKPETSDYDFFVEFEDRGWKGSFKRYMGFKLALEDLLGRPVDLVEPTAVTYPYFVEVANRNRELVYAA